MAHILDQDKILYENLVDAGCDEKMISKCIQSLESESWNSCLVMLSKHRKQLLHNLHEAQKQIDCLDYLDHSIRNNYMRGEQ